MNTQIKEQEKTPLYLITTPSIVTTVITKKSPKKSPKKTRPDLYKLTYDATFSDVFNEFLDKKEQSDIEMKRFCPDLYKHTFADEIKQSNPRLKTCFIKQAYKVMMEALKNPKLDKRGKTIGYCIPSRGKLNALKKNPLYKHFNFFVKAKGSTYHAKGSTYHANSAKYGKPNGYCHWYTFSDNIMRIRNWSLRRLEKAITFDNHGLNNVPNQDIRQYQRAPKSFVFDTDKCCRIERQPFLVELDMFRKQFSDSFATVLTHMKFFDSKYIYIDNTCKKKTLMGTTLGRNYTLVGLMKKEMRERLFTGYLEVDLDCSNQSLMLNLMVHNTRNSPKYQHGTRYMKKCFPELGKMLENKTQYRQKFASVFDTDIATAKKIIQQISISPKSKVVNKYLVQGVDKPSETRIAKASGHIKALVKDCINLQNLILMRFYDRKCKKDRFSYKIGTLTLSDIPWIVDEEIRLKNATLASAGKGKSLASRRYHQIYCLIEHQVRNCIIDYVEKKHGKVDIYQVHDAIFFKNKTIKNINEITDHVKASLGFDIKLTWGILGKK